MANGTEDMGLATRLVDGQALVGGILHVPTLRGLVERERVDANEHIADAGAAGHLVAPVAIAAAKAGAGLLPQVLGPFADGLVAARAAQHGGSGDGEYGRQGVALSLSAAWVGGIGSFSSPISPRISIARILT
jgi:hypothetical protein